jgi:hypothetical protein
LSSEYLLAVHAESAFVFTEAGRIARNADPDRGPGPRFCMWGSANTNVAFVRHDVGETTARMLLDLAARETPLALAGSTPVHAGRYVQLLEAEAPVVDRGAGLCYWFPYDLAYEHGLVLATSDMPRAERDRLRVRPDIVLPEPFVELGFSTIGKLWEPWCIALHDGEVASIVETVRLARRGAEAGVNTVPTLRGRGFAAAATAGWATLPSLRSRALFYSTAMTNRSSQRVTERLGLRFLGASFSVT